MSEEVQADAQARPPAKVSGDSQSSVTRGVSEAPRSEAQNQSNDVSGSVPVDPSERIDLLLRDLSSAPTGLSASEAQRRLLQWGPNELRRRGGRKWPRELAHQQSHPLALLLWLAAGLSFAVGSDTVAIAVLLVIVLNALFAFVQEMQAERAVEALEPVRITRFGGLVGSVS